jgi:hypothetical protein
MLWYLLSDPAAGLPVRSHLWENTGALLLSYRRLCDPISITMAGVDPSMLPGK